jgi:hypothetical protein
MGSAGVIEVSWILYLAATVTLAWITIRLTRASMT